jgi:hypothetical protein
MLSRLNLIVLRLKAKEFIRPVLYRCRLLEYVAIASEIHWLSTHYSNMAERIVALMLLGALDN